MVTATRQRVNGMRGALLGLLAFLHVLGAVGMPLPVVPVGSQSGKSQGGPAYPCQNRPCGCLSYEQCWAGDCCCFTLEQKIAWARKQGEYVPSTALAKLADKEEISPPEACDHCAREKTCCESSQNEEPGNNKPAPGGWKLVIGSFVSGCQGQGDSGPISVFPVAIPGQFTHEMARVSVFFAGFDNRNEDAKRLSNAPTPPPPKA